ncbi:MAG: response regulator, partial [Desulfobacteraceae bacterium]
AFNGMFNRFLEFNDIACQKYGYPRNDLLKLTPKDLLAPGMKIRVQKHVDTLLANKRHIFETMHQSSEGRVFPVEISAFLFDYKNQTTVLSIVRDITKRRRMEEQIRQTHKLESLGTLTGGIAHDFNNILSAIIGYAELSRTIIPENEKAYDYAKKILKAGHRAKALTQQILTFSRQDRLEPQPVLIKPVVEETLKLLKASLPASIEIHERIETHARVLGDPTRIHQIVMNLCTNASHAMRKDGGALEVGLVRISSDSSCHLEYTELKPKPYIHLWVRDTGCGMPPDVVKRIFDPFFTTKAPGEGTGMGLAVVHGIVSELDGIIHVTSEPSKGTHFDIFLPETLKGSETEAAQPRDTTPPSGTGRILFVDDEPDIVEIAEALLLDLGYSVITHTRAADALERFKAEADTIDAVITDMTMPQIPGDQLAKAMLSIRPDIPVIICTGFSEKMDKAQALELGMKGYLMKPLAKSKLAGLLMEILPKKATDS